MCPDLRTFKGLITTAYVKTLAITGFASLGLSSNPNEIKPQSDQNVSTPRFQVTLDFKDKVETVNLFLLGLPRPPLTTLHKTSNKMISFRQYVEKSKAFVFISSYRKTATRQLNFRVTLCESTPGVGDQTQLTMSAPWPCR